jgi:hypothetical protein
MMKGMLTTAEAEQLVIATLKSRFESQSVSIVNSRTVDREFGWVFFLAVDKFLPADEPQVRLPRQVIVNKYSEQILASSVDHSPEQFIKLYEEFLAENQVLGREWCLTLAFPHRGKNWSVQRLAKKAKEAGFYEVTGNSRSP